MPLYRDGAYGGETLSLEGERLRFELHNRRTGWGWGEIFVENEGHEVLFAVLEHIGEVYLAGYDRPLRLEAAGHSKADGGIEFEVSATGSQGDNGSSPCTGRVGIAVPKDDRRIEYSLAVTARESLQLRSLRGPWLRVGADSFGARKHDAIFPGIEWLVGDEWSSGTDWFEHPEALRVAPHPHKVSIPVMAISHGGTALGLSWDPGQSALSHQTRIRMPQPVFASPNFIDRRNDHIMGVMFPSARWGLTENHLIADPPVPVPKGMEIRIDGIIHVVDGESLDVILDWVRKQGMPEPPGPRYGWDETLERIARSYDTNFWTEGKGWGLDGKGAPRAPGFLRKYLEGQGSSDLVESLRRKAEWCDRQPREGSRTDLGRLQIGGDEESARTVAEQLLAIQTPEGAFTFEPGGRHKTGLTERAALWRPLGQAGDAALDLCATASVTLLTSGQRLGEKRFLDGARRALEYSMRYERPEGGDWWETPLHSPNLLAAGNAAVAYYLGYREFGDERYLQQAVHWIRCLLPFTHLWQPFDMEMIYNTKPCLNSTAWFLSDWTAKHVQWEVLGVFSRSENLGIDWSSIDTEVDWRTYQRGVTTAALRWMIDHQDQDWVHFCEFPRKRIEGGAWDSCFCDTFDPVEGTYGGAPIMPDAIAENVLALLKRSGE